MSRMQMQTKARELQRQASALPLVRAPHPERGNGLEFFTGIDRELMWGLTLNK